MSFWTGKKVLVTGGAGFIGSHVVESLLERGATVTVPVLELGREERRNLSNVMKDIVVFEVDLRGHESCLKAGKGQEIVINAAAKVAGIDYNRQHPGTMFRENILISCNMLEAARICEVERFLVVSSACVYPRHCTVPTPETEGFDSVPEPTNEGYGWAKRMAELQAMAYSQEFGMKIAIARPYNCYGPRDHFDPAISHVIPALIKRVFDGEDPLVVWGDGEQSRAFINVADLARGLITLVEKYPEADAVNLGTDEEIEIKDLAALIVKLSGRKTELAFDTSKPAGQPRRNCDTSKARGKIGFSAEVSLEQGLSKMIEWYRNELGR